MARIAMGAKAIQVFKGALNALNVNPWLQNIGGECCDPAVSVAQDRLNPTVNPENALVHTRPFGNRDWWQFTALNDTRRAEVVKSINTHGVGAQIELMVIPTFSLLHTVQVVTLAEEAGLTFTLKTRNGTVLPAGQLIKVSETDAAAGCGEVGRVQAAGAWTGIGPLATAHRVHTLGVSDKGGEFALEADVLILEVTALPAGGVVGSFDLLVHANYIAPGRSEAAR